MAQNQYYYQQQQQYQQHPTYPQQQLQRQQTVQYSNQPNPRQYPSQQQQQMQHLYQHQQSYPSAQPRSAYAQQQQQQPSQAFAQARQVFAQPQQQQQPQQYYAQQQQRPQSQAQSRQTYPHSQQLHRQSSFVQQPQPPPQQQQVYYQQQPQPQAVAPSVVYPNTQEQVYSKQAPPSTSAPGSRYSHYTPPNPQAHVPASRPVSGSFSLPKPPPQIGSVPSSSAANDSRRPLPTPTSKAKARPESMPVVPSVLRLQTFPGANPNPIPVQAPAPSSPTRPSVLNTPPSSISTKSSTSSFVSSSQSSSNSATSSPTRSGNRPLPTPGSRAAKHSSLDLGPSASGATFGSRTASRSSSPEKQLPPVSSGNNGTPFKSALSATKPVSQSKPPGPFKSYRPAVPPPIVPEEIEIDLRKPGSPTKFVPLWKRGLPASSPSPERPSANTSTNANASFSRAPASNGRPLPNSPTITPDLSTMSLGQGSLFNGAAPMGTRLPPPQHPNKKDVPPPPGKAFLSPKARKIELALSDDEYLSANESEGYVDVDGESEWDERSEDASESDGRYADPRTPSPQYGIRELPGRSRTMIDHGPARTRVAVNGNMAGGRGNHESRGHSPKPPLPARSSTSPQPPSAGGNGASQFPSSAQSMTLRMASVSLSNGGPGGRTNVRSASPARSQVPSRSASAAAARQTLTFSSSQNGNTKSGRRDRRQREVVDLDDAPPPPSLRKSPGLGTPQTPIPQPQTPPALPPRRWTPSTTPTTTHASRRSAPVQPQMVESPVPVGGRGSRPDIPTISFPDGNEEEYEESGEDGSDFEDGPTIMISGPDSPAPPPRIAVSTPQISVSGPNSRRAARSVPSIAASSQSSSSSSYSQPHHLARYNESKRELKILPPRKTGGLVCGGCDGAIIGRIVSAMGIRWHPGCFRCTVCNELLEHVSSYEHDGRPYCHLDYHENFAPRCYHCKTSIIDERFITLDDPALGKRTYHEQHFFCAECGDPFLTPRDGATRTAGELSVDGDGEFEDDDVGFTVYKGHPYCEACHVRLRLPKCKRCKKSIRDGAQAVEALGGKWCWECFTCASCEKPFEDPSFFLRSDKPFCESCFSIILRNEV